MQTQCGSLSKKTKIGCPRWCVERFGTNLRPDKRTPERRNEKYPGSARANTTSRSSPRHDLAGAGGTQDHFRMADKPPTGLEQSFRGSASCRLEGSSDRKLSFAFPFNLHAFPLAESAAKQRQQLR